MKLRLTTQIDPQESVGQAGSSLAVGSRAPEMDLAAPWSSSVLIKKRPPIASQMDPWSKTKKKASSASGAQLAKRKRKLTAFVAMPFSDSYQEIFKVIREACELTNIKAIRADEICEPGPIIKIRYSTILLMLI
jgi:hypothetical protein